MNHLVFLSDTDLLALDGHTSDDKVKTEIKRVRNRLDIERRHPKLTEAEANLVQSVVELAESYGKVGWERFMATECRVCDKSCHHDRPIIEAVDFNRGRAYTRGLANMGACMECVDKLRPVFAAELAGATVEIPWQLTGVANGARRSDLVQCEQCSWEGAEDELGLINGVLGGTFPGRCPKCSATRRIGSNPFTRLDGHVIHHRPATLVLREKLSEVIAVLYQSEAAREQRLAEAIMVGRALRAITSRGKRKTTADLRAKLDGKLSPARVRDARNTLAMAGAVDECEFKGFLADPAFAKLRVPPAAKPARSAA